MLGKVHLPELYLIASHPESLPFDQVSLLPEDYDDIEDGEIDLGGVSLRDLTESASLAESAERV